MTRAWRWLSAYRRALSTAMPAWSAIAWISSRWSRVKNPGLACARVMTPTSQAALEGNTQALGGVVMDEGAGDDGGVNWLAVVVQNDNTAAHGADVLHRQEQNLLQDSFQVEGAGKLAADVVQQLEGGSSFVFTFPDRTQHNDCLAEDV